MVKSHKILINFIVNSFKVLTLLLIISGAYGSNFDEKTLAKENAEILGIDKNKNEVRDDVETYITKYLHKTDPKIYKAYFNYAQSLSLQLKHRYDKKKLDKLDMQLNRDHHCIKGLDGEKLGALGIKELRGKVLESYIRFKAWEVSAGTKSINTFPYIDKENWAKQCR